MTTPAYLQIAEGPNAGRRYPLDREKIVMGRHPDCDIVVEAGAVSRHHAQLLLVDDQFFIEDLKSRNGTFLNDQAVAERKKIRDEDLIRICDMTFMFRGEPGIGSGNLSSIDSSTDTGGQTAVLFDEEDPNKSHSSIMSKLDVTAGNFGQAATAATRLEAILELTKNLGKNLTLDEILTPVLDSLFKSFMQADRGFIMLLDENGAPQTRCAKSRREDGEAIRVSRTIVNHVMNTKEAILSADAAGDMRFSMSQSIADFRIRSMMCAPLVNNDGEVLGVVQIDTANQLSRFQEADLEVMAGIASQAAISIQNALLHDKAMEQQALERDLELAQSVQVNLLPKRRPDSDEYQFSDFYRAANKIGGDYYDYVELPDGRLATIVADVSGHGVAAALLMVKLSAEAKFCLATTTQPNEVVSRLNAVLCGDDAGDRFVTLVMAVLDPSKHELVIVNAGHFSPLVRHANGELEEIGEEVGSFPLGIVEETQYEQYVYSVQTGDTVAMCTDGIIEAMNGDADQYGMERFQTQVRREFSSLDDLTTAIVDDVHQFVDGQPQADDMCMMCLRRK